MLTMAIKCALGEDCNCAPYDDDDDEIYCDDCPHCEHVITHADTGLIMRYRMDGRLGDICTPDGQAIDCVQIADYDWIAGEVVPGSHHVEESFLEWIDEAFQ